MHQFLKGITYKFHQDLDEFKIGIGNYLAFPKRTLRYFNIQLHDAYVAQIDIFQWKLNRVDILLAHNRGFFWNQEQSAHNLKVTDNWKERVQTFGYSH